MKKLFTRLMLVAVAAMAIEACQNEPAEINVKANKIAITVTADLDDVRSSFGDRVENGDNDYYPSKWDGGEAVCFSLNEAALVSATNTLDGTRATFSVELVDDGTTEGTIYAFSPKGVWDSSNSANCKGGFTGINSDYQDAYVVIPEVQNPTAASVDPAVHLLAGKTTYTEGIPASVNMKFSTVAAFGRMTLTNFTETVTKVKITASQALVGTGCYYYYAGASEGQLTNANVNTITINNPAEDNLTFWFGCAPADLSEGSLVVKVYTADASYTKTIDLAGKTLKFVQGEVSNFNVNMADVAKDVVDETAYALVTSLSEVTDGQYIIAGYDSSTSKYYALPNAAVTTAARIPGDEVTVSNNLISGVDAVGYEWLFTLTDGKLSITNGDYYFNQSGSSNTSLKVTTDEATWAVFASENIAGCFKLVPDNATTRMLLFRVHENETKETLEFGAYTFSNETGADYSGIYLFKYGGTVKTALATPEVAATVQNNNEIVVSWTAVEGVKDYTVSCEGMEDRTVTGTSVTYTGLDYGTKYTFSVVANPADTDSNAASNPGVVSATTKADPNATVTEVYRKITSASELTDGTYLIVYEDGNTAFNGSLTTLDASNNGSAVTITDSTIESNTETDAMSFTITASNGNIKSAKGLYIGHTSDANKLSQSTTTAFTNTISFNDDGSVNIVCSGGAYLRYNATSGQERFRYYKSSSYTNQKAIALYKKIGESSGDEGGSEEPAPVQLEAPALRSSNITTTGYTVEWDAVANASNYEVSVDGGAATVVDGTSYTVSDATSNTQYVVTVVAKGDGISYLDSAAVSINVTTLAESDDSALTESMDIFGSTGTLASDSSSISWTGDNFTVTNYKGSSSTAIRTSDTDHYRVYANSTLTLTASNGLSFAKLVFTCTGATYATALKETLGENATASGSTVTWTGSAAEVSGTLTAQVRISKVEATFE